MIDAHCHLDSDRFSGSPDQVLDAARSCGVRGWMVAGVGPGTWDAQAQWADVPGVKTCFGLHPWVAASSTDHEVDDALAALAERVDGALGELGLDRSARVAPDSMPRQVRAFRAQLALARERDIPVVLHVVGAHGAALEILEGDGVPASGGMVHGWTGAWELAQRYLRLGLALSFGGVVTRPEARKARAALSAVPDDRFLIETDCPDQPPAAHAGELNRPEWLLDVVSVAANVRGCSPEAVASATARNAERLFGEFV